MSTYQEMIDRDLELLWSIQRFCQHNKWVKNVFSPIVHRHPYRDITSIIWVIFVIGIFEVGAGHFWVTIMNLAFCVAARLILEAKRPVEYDARLQPMTDLNAESYGFPSVESYMSVIIIGHIFLHTKSMIFLPFGILIIFIVGFSRLYSRSRFPHQIVASWILAVPGLYIGMHYCDKMDFKSMTDRGHAFCVGFVGACIACSFALSMENNDSRLLYIPKQEFVRVFVEILSGGKDLAKNEEEEVENEKFFDEMIDETTNPLLLTSKNIRKYTANLNPETTDPEENVDSITPESARSTITRRSVATAAQQSSAGAISSRSSSSNNTLHTARTSSSASTSTMKKARKPATYVKSDSLYFLQKSLEEREYKLKNQSTGENTEGTNEGITTRKLRSRSYGTEDFFSTDDDSESEYS